VKSGETELVKAAIAYLRMRGWMAWRNNTGAMAWSHKGKRWYVKFGVPGASDVFAIKLGSGRFLAVECKVGRNKPTKAQQAFIDDVRRHGGLAVCIWSLDDLHEYIGG